jgi:hypothetical protein
MSRIIVHNCRFKSRRVWKAQTLRYACCGIFLQAGRTRPIIARCSAGFAPYEVCGFSSGMRKTAEFLESETLRYACSLETLNRNAVEGAFFCQSP